MAVNAAADLAFALQDAGVPVVSAQSSTFGILKKADVIEHTDGADVQRRVTMIDIATGSISDITEDLPITVGGASYLVRWWQEKGDGLLTEVLIVEAKPA